MTRNRGTDEVRARIVEASIEQLAHDGMRGLTHRKVEERAGVAQGTVKYHFGSLDGLIEAVLRAMLEVERQGTLRNPNAGEPTKAPATVEDIPAELWQMARRTWDEFSSRPLLVRARYELFLHAATRPDLQALIGEMRGEMIDQIVAELDFSPNPRASARMLAALVDGMLFHQLSAPNAELGDYAPTFMIVATGATAFMPTEPQA